MSENLEVQNPEEKVSAIFNPIQLHKAQDRAWDLLVDLKKAVKPGMTEAEATAIYNQMQVQSGAERYWHPPKIRFGKNTLRSFREPSDASVILQENDIFFLDLGPIYDGYEADVGKTFTLGGYPPGEKVIAAAEALFQEVKREFLNNKKSGAELYVFAETRAKEEGFELVGEGANGHRISDFPHAIHHRGNLRNLSGIPLADRWILEIQLRDLKNQIGAFYEDILF